VRRPNNDVSAEFVIGKRLAMRGPGIGFGFFQRAALQHLLPKNDVAPQVWVSGVLGKLIKRQQQNPKAERPLYPLGWAGEWENGFPRSRGLVVAGLIHT
jgi:hypothetical protein